MIRSTINFYGVLLALLLQTSVPLLAQQKAARQQGYGDASYASPQEGQYLMRWLLTDPVLIAGSESPVDDEVQQKIFMRDNNLKLSVDAKGVVAPLNIDSKEYAWHHYSSKGAVINLDSLYKKDFAYCYALAEVRSDIPQKRMLAIGSDDGVRVWVNGALVHSNWRPRGLVPDEDVFSVVLNKGSNQILIKTQDISQEWGFSARFLDGKSLSARLLQASAGGDLDLVAELIEAGADVNYRNDANLSALHQAQLNGRKEVESLLVSKGARQDKMPDPALLIDDQYKEARKDGPGIAILVAKEGKILYSKGMGYADIENKIPVTTQTKFRIGSVTKQFTAAAILKLAEEGKLTLSDNLSKFIPDFPRGNEVTIHHLLTHTSGIHSYTNKPEFVAKVTSPVTPDELLQWFKNDPYDFNPGESYLYNNSGYFLLGYIIEKVSGKPYDAYLGQQFFKPLGMTSTGVHASTLKLDNEAIGYALTNETYDKSLNWDMSWAGGAGAIYSTVEDLYKWNEALYQGKVISKESLDKALTPVVLNNGEHPGTMYGYGLQLGAHRGLQLVQHGGGLHGFLSQLAWYPQEKMTIVLLTNVAPAELDLNTNRIANYYLWNKLDPQPSYSSANVEKKDYSEYAGRYDFTGGMIMTFTAEDGGLHAQLSGQSKFPVFSAGGDEFFWKVVEARVTFLRDKEGRVTQGKFTQNGNEIVIKRLEDVKEVVVDTALLREYTGRYDFGGGAVMTITEEGGNLFAQLTGQGKFPIFPSSDHEFYWKVVAAKIKFVRGDNGKVSHGDFSQGGVNLKVSKIE